MQWGGDPILHEIHIICLFFVDMAIVVYVLSMSGMFGIYVSTTALWIISAEIFPTAVRSIGMGTGSLASRVGGILAPFILLLVSISISQLILFSV